jgi:pyruvate/2-oxoglutarate/acetoin dehydrogenase E1 component
MTGHAGPPLDADGPAYASCDRVSASDGADLLCGRAVTAYFSELCRTMSWLAEQPNALFIGQAVVYEGTAMHRTLRDVPMDQRIEFPVAENCQLGACTGLALAGFLPISIFPRMNFLLEATSQLVQHLDKIVQYSDGGYNPRVIIRTAIATDKPLNPGEQHVSDYTPAFRAMLSATHVQVLEAAEQIMPAYQAAVERRGPSLIIEHLGMYND